MEGYGFITVNRFGFICLNSIRVFFGDIDAPSELIQKAQKTIDDVAHQHRLSFRVYRTYAGIRLIETSQLWRANSQTTFKVLRELRCDEEYIQCVQRDDTFRARLSPKPWRSDPSQTCFLWNDADPKKYLANPRWAVATYLRTTGNRTVTNPEIKFVVDLHDEKCKAHDLKSPLA